jgi:hypothetical protein
LNILNNNKLKVYFKTSKIYFHVRIGPVLKMVSIAYFHVTQVSSLHYLLFSAVNENYEEERT